MSDDFIEEAKISVGNFDNVGECQYAVPSHWDIGKVYKRLIKQVALEKKIDVVDAIIEVYHSFISDKIDDYNSSVSSCSYFRMFHWCISTMIYCHFRHRISSILNIIFSISI